MAARRSLLTTGVALAVALSSALIGIAPKASAEPAEEEPPNYYLHAPTRLTAGSDGNVWFAAGNSVGRLKPDGDIVSYRFHHQVEIGDVASNADGIWFTAGRSIGKFSYDGVLTTYRLGLTADPTALTTDSDGHVWFAGKAGRVGRISSSGVITEYVIKTADKGAYLESHDIAVGADGKAWLWVSEPDDDQPEVLTQHSLVQVNPAGSVLARLGPLEYDNSDFQGDRYASLTRGADGAVWYARNYNAYNEPTTGWLGQLVGSSVGQEWEVPGVGELALGPDGAIWMVNTDEFDGPSLGRWTVAGGYTGIPISLDGSSLIARPGDRLWATTGRGILSVNANGTLAGTFNAPDFGYHELQIAPSATSARASWTSSGAVTSYELELQPGDRTFRTSTRSATIPELLAGRSYELTVRARGAAGTGLPTSVIFTTQPHRAAGPAADFTGDGRADIAVWRPSNGAWYIRGRSPIVYGVAGDIPVAADYSGDDRADIAVWRPGNGTWYIRGQGSTVYGRAGDIPVPGDYTGDGRVDLAVFRPSDGRWYVRGRPSVAWGTSGDIPVPGNYLGDRRTDLMVWRPSTGVWHRRGGGAVQWGSPAMCRSYWT